MKALARVDACLSVPQSRWTVAQIAAITHLAPCSVRGALQILQPESMAIPKQAKGRRAKIYWQARRETTP